MPLESPPDVLTGLIPGAAAANEVRSTPYSREAEQSVLGSIMLDNSILDQVADLLVADDFYVGAHRAIYQAILTLSERGAPADPIVLKELLEKNNELDAVGGYNYLFQLVKTVPTTAHAVSYGRVVHEKSVLRDLAREATAIVERVQSNDDAPLDDILDEAEKQIFDVGEKRDQRRSSYHEMKSVVTTVLDRLETLADRGDAVTGVASGFTDLDKLLTGLQPSDLLILAGRPAMGKTSLAMNIASNAAMGAAKTPVAIFSLEMSKEQLASRFISSIGSIDAQGLRTGRIEDYGRLTQTASRLSEAPIYVDDTPALSVMALRSKARRLKREKGIQLIVVDYLQLMRSSGQSDNRTHEITQISQGLTAIAKEMDVPVIALSQLSRSVESRTDKRPILSDLRESGSIEQDADVVMFVFREEYYKTDDPKLFGKAELIVAKQRNGPTGTVVLTFQHKFTRFDNHAPSPDYQL